MAASPGPTGGGVKEDSHAASAQPAWSRAQGQSASFVRAASAGAHPLRHGMTTSPVCCVAEGAETTSPRAPQTSEPVTSGCWLLSFRGDLDPAYADAYWEGGHGDVVAANPGTREYRQHHFSPDDHGFWPAPARLGTRIPADWRLDGMPEVTFGRSFPRVGMIRATAKIYLDEQNAFERMLAQFTGPRGGRWFTGPHQHDLGARAVVLIRRRHGLRPGSFRRFVHDKLAPALLVGGALELRSYVLIPWTRWLWITPGLTHENPAHRRYAAAIVIGAADRAGIDRVLHSPQVVATHDAQIRHCVGLHAYAVTRTVPRVLEHDRCSRAAIGPTGQAIQSQ